MRRLAIEGAHTEAILVGQAIGGLANQLAADTPEIDLNDELCALDAAIKNVIAKLAPPPRVDGWYHAGASVRVHYLEKGFATCGSEDNISVLAETMHDVSPCVPCLLVVTRGYEASK